MKYILAIASLFLSVLLVSCATKSVPIEASLYLLSTDRDSESFLNEMAEELKKNRYEVETLNFNVGLLKMEPRRFVILRDEQRTYGTQVIEMRQEGGSVKLSMEYECEYGQISSKCVTDDEYATEKIRRIERIIIAMVNRRLFKKKGGTKRSRSREI